MPVYASNLRTFSALVALVSACALGAPDDDSFYSPAFGIGTFEAANGTLAGQAKAVAVDSNHVYFGGSFAKVSGYRVNNIVRIHKKTQRIERLGTADACGTNGEVLVIKTVAGGVHVGGRFTHAGTDTAGLGGVETGPYAFYDGKAWSPVGPKLTGTNGASVTAIAFGSNVTYVAGAFGKAGDVAVNNIALFRGPNYDPLYDQGRLANGLGGTVTTLGGFKVTGLQVTNTHLYVGGNFSIAGGQSVSGAAQWNWTTEKWDGMKGGLSHAPALHPFDMAMDDLSRIFYAYRGLHHYEDTGWVAVPGTEASTITRVLAKTPFGMMIQGSGGTAFDSGGISFETAQGWKALPLSKMGFTTSSDMGFAADDRKVWIGSGAGLQGALGMAWYDGKQFGVIGNGLRNTRAGGTGFYDFVEFEGKIIAAGAFSHLGSVAAEGVARWTGEAWESLGEGFQSVWRLSVFKGKLYASGTLARPGKSTEGGLAVWTGSAWEIVPGFEKGGIEALAATGKYLWMAGPGVPKSTAAGGELARWDGTTVETFGKELGSTSQIGINSIVPVGETGACVSGYFSRVGTVPAGGAACFDGAAWTPMGAALTTGNVTSMTAVGDDFYLGCSCTFPGGAKNIAKWDGKDWVAVGAGLDKLVQRLKANGSDLYVVGAFGKAGDLTVNGVARWDGKAWSALGSGLSPANGQSLYVGAGGLWLGGGFTLAGGIPSRNIALYGNVEKKPDLPMGIVRAAGPGKRGWTPLKRMGRTGVEFGSDGEYHRADGRLQPMLPAPIPAGRGPVTPD